VPTGELYVEDDVDENWFCCQGACGDEQFYPKTDQGWCNRNFNCINCYNDTLIYVDNMDFIGCEAGALESTFDAVCKYV